MKHTYTYGQLPPCKIFFELFDENIGEVDFRFGNDKRMGNGIYTKYEVWDELVKCVLEGTDESLDWASCVLSVNDIEWV
jgi:hypothetical protein